MPRKKKTEEQKEVKEVVKVQPSTIYGSFGSGMTRKNNELMAKEEERNE